MPPKMASVAIVVGAEFSNPSRAFDEVCARRGSVLRVFQLGHVQES